VHDPQLASLIDEFYAIISGPAGPRDWSRERAILHPQARLMRTGVDEDGRPWIRVMSLDEYIADTAPFFAAGDFHEIEVARRVDRFGNWAHVRSVYEARVGPVVGGAATRGVDQRRESQTSADVAERKPAAGFRGVNSIQLFHDGERWRVVSVLWDNERAGLEVPAEWR
jgi:hypothetical protein